SGQVCRNVDRQSEGGGWERCALRLPRNGERLAPDFRAFFEATRAPCLAFSLPELTAIAANAAFLRVTALSESELLGRDLCELFAAAGSAGASELAGRLRGALDRALSSRAPDVMSIESSGSQLRRGGLAGAGGEARPWTVTTTPVNAEGGGIAFVIQSFEDVS